MDHIARIYYINLEHRQDRRAEFEQEMEKLGVYAKTERIEAVHVPGRGHLGATLSHIKAVETFLESGLPLCLICEDDFSVKTDDSESFWERMQAVFDRSVSFDVLMLSHNIQEHTATEYEGIVRLRKSFTASGYLLTRAFAPRLLENLVEGLQCAVKEEEATGRKTHHFCLDVYWEELMKEEGVQWLALQPALGYQRPSYSDIEGHKVNHGV